MPALWIFPSSVPHLGLSWATPLADQHIAHTARCCSHRAAHHDASAKRPEEEYKVLGGHGGIIAKANYEDQKYERGGGVVRRTDTFECVGRQEQMF
jgi:hypothetical protein